MYFIISKTLGFFSFPSNLIVCFALAGLLLARLRPWIGRKFSTTALVAIVIAGISPLGNMLITPLEQRFPGLKYPEQKIDGIIILGGSFDNHAAYLNTVILGEGTEPLNAVADLSRRYPDAKIMFSGGTASLFGARERIDEAALARQMFISFGIDPKRIVVEDQSRNTEENARFTARLIEPKPQSVWLLVTAAYHMPRAIGTFRRTGFDVIGYPVGWRTRGWRDFYWPTPSVTENLRRVDVATREWIGMAAYYLLGYSSAWFPR